MGQERWMIQSRFWPLAKKYWATRRLKRKSRAWTASLRLEALEDRAIPTTFLISPTTAQGPPIPFVSPIAAVSSAANSAFANPLNNPQITAGLEALWVDIHYFQPRLTGEAAGCEVRIGASGCVMQQGFVAQSPAAQNVTSTVDSQTLDRILEPPSGARSAEPSAVDASTVAQVLSETPPSAAASVGVTAQSPATQAAGAPALVSPAPQADNIAHSLTQPAAPAVSPPGRADDADGTTGGTDVANTAGVGTNAASQSKSDAMPVGAASTNGQALTQAPTNGTGARTEELPDSFLLQRFVVNREEAAFTALVQRHQPQVLGTCQRVLGDSYAAEDAVQATFLVLARKAGLLDHRSSLSGWLCTVAYRLALRIRAVAARNRKREKTAVCGRQAKSFGESLIDLERREIHRVLYEELQLLPERYRQPLVLCYLDGRTHAEAAEQMGLPRGSMAKRIGEALNALRNRLIARGIDF
jgi:RNA polymerase sigma factor (sigma-70 family)